MDAETQRGHREAAAKKAAKLQTVLDGLQADRWGAPAQKFPADQESDPSAFLDRIEAESRQNRERKAQKSQTNESDEDADFRRAIEESRREAEELANRERAEMNSLEREIANLGPEPAGGVTIRLTLPTGKAATRKFEGSGMARAVYLWGIGEMREANEGKLLKMEEVELRVPPDRVIHPGLSLEAQDITTRVAVRLAVIRKK
jgi:hypothetical protein